MITIKKQLDMDLITFEWEINLPARVQTINDTNSIRSYFSFKRDFRENETLYFCKISHIYDTEKKGLIPEKIFFGRRSTDARVAKHISKMECERNAINALKACGLIEKDYVYTYISQVFLSFLDEVNNFMMNNFWHCYTDSHISYDNKNSPTYSGAENIKEMFISKFSKNANHEEKGDGGA